MKAIRLIVPVAAAASALMFAGGATERARTAGPSEAPAGFDGGSNGHAEEFCANQDALVNSPNSPKIPEDECSFDTAEEEFTGPETVADGVGPVFNATGCGECHAAGPGFDPNDFTKKLVGATSEIVERRAAFWDPQRQLYRDHPGGSLIQNRALRQGEQETVLPGHNVIALRATLSVLGDGFVEAVANETFQAIAAAQPSAQRGQVINVPVLEMPGRVRVGRFGHKAQQASLVSFSADAYVNEMGITSPLQPDENSFNGVAVEDSFPGMDDEGVDVELFALFMRSTKAPGVFAARMATRDAQDGSALFNSVGCAVCHTRTIQTSAPGNSINGGAFKVTQALGDKIIHPFSDFLLHDVGTGDGIVQNGGMSTRNKMRTAALWGLNLRGRFMHDQLSFSLEDAIARHGNQAASSRTRFNELSATNKKKLLTFLSAL